MPVSWMSTNRQAKDGRAGAARKLSAESNPLGSKPAPRNRRPSARLALASSSIIATLFVPMDVAGHASSAQEARLLPLGAGLSGRFEQAGLARQGGELRNRAHPELGGDRAAMQLDGALVYAERCGNLFVHPAVHHLLEHLPLALGKPGKPPSQLLVPVARGSRVCVTFESPPHRCEQGVLRSALVEKIDCSLAHGRHRARDISLPGEKHKRQPDARL